MSYPDRYATQIVRPRCRQDDPTTRRSGGSSSSRISFLLEPAQTCEIALLRSCYSNALPVRYSNCPKSTHNVPVLKGLGTSPLDYYYLPFQYIHLRLERPRPHPCMFW
jgi:hypothetical protein